MSSSGRISKKSRSGCQRCKQRRSKCDESKPECHACLRAGVTCPGYQRLIKWSSKYERISAPSDVTRKTAETELNHEFAVNFSKQAENFQQSLSRNSQLPNRTLRCLTDPITNLSPLSVVDVSGNDSKRQADPFLCVADDCKELERTSMRPNRDDLIATTRSYSQDLYSQLEMNLDTLVSYYFSWVCAINSGFDSMTNPLRVLVADLMHSHPVITRCMMSMSAAHFFQMRQDVTRVALTYRTEAISCLAFEVAQLSEPCIPLSYRKGTCTAALLGTVLLGMTSSWNDANLIDVTFILGARSLLQSSSTTQPSEPGALPRHIRNCLVGLVGYWEAITSFSLDQELDTCDYLFQLCAQAELDGGSPNPWAGTHFLLYLFMAKTGAITRKLRVLRRLATKLRQRKSQSGYYEEILEEARELEAKVRRYIIPAAASFEDTNDKQTPLSHFQTMGYVYQISILIELYRGFPELMNTEKTECGENSDEPPHSAQAKKFPSRRSDFLIHLAINALTLMCSIPETSGTKAIQMLPLVIAGSALQHTYQNNSKLTLQDTLNTPELCMAQSDIIINHWRSVVRGRGVLLYRYVGLDTVHRGLEIIEKVWELSDNRRQNETMWRGADVDFVHWVDVMCSEKMETLLG